MQKITYHCKNYRKKTNLPNNIEKFCYSTIQGIRDDKSNKITKFTLKKSIVVYV